MEEFEVNKEFDRIKYDRFYPYNILVIIISIYFLGSTLLTLLAYLMPKDFLPNFDSYLQGISQILFLLLPTLYFASKSNLTLRSILRLEKMPDKNLFLLSFIGIIWLQMFIIGFQIVQEHFIPNSLLPFYREFEYSLEEIYKKLFSGNSIIDLIRGLIIGALIPAISEEALFRGFFQKNLEYKINPVKAIIITSVIFSIIHLNPISFLPLVFIGAYLGFLAYSSNSLIIPVTIHFVNNAIAVIIIFNPKFSEVEDDFTKIPLIYGILMALLGLLMLIATGYYMLKIRDSKSEGSS
jgi:hypothetical protein